MRRLLLEWGILLSIIALALFALRHYITYVEPEKLAHRFVRIESPKIKSPIRILHISDIQAGLIEAYQYRIQGNRGARCGSNFEYWRSTTGFARA